MYGLKIYSLTKKKTQSSRSPFRLPFEVLNGILEVSIWRNLYIRHKMRNVLIVDFLILVFMCCATWPITSTDVTQGHDSLLDMQPRPTLTPITSVADVSLVVSMICRNEDVNFKSNLALWLPIAKYFGMYPCLR